jgi:O-antigen/teichoic acid export membrane protein
VTAASFARGFLYTLATNALVLLFGVLASVVAARLLGPAAFGTYSLALLFAYMVGTFTNLGLAPATVFHVSRARHPLGEIVVNTITLSLLVGTGAVVVGGLVAWMWGGRILPGVPLGLAALALATVPVTQLLQNLRGVLHGMQRFGWLSLATAAEAVLKAVLVGGALLLLGTGIGGAVAANVVASALVAVALAVALRRVAAGHPWRPSRAYLRDSMTYGGKAYLGNAVQFLNYRIATLLLNLWHGPVLVGYYAVSILFAERLNMISGAASTVLFPRVASSERPGEATAAVCRVVFWTTLAAALAFFAISRLLVLVLYSARYADAILPLQLLLPGMVALSVTDVVAHDFAGRGQPLTNTWLAAVTLVANVALCLVLVPRQGAPGAALATTLSYVMQAMVALWWHWRVSGNTPVDMLLPRRSDLRRVAGMLRRPPAAVPVTP